MTLKIKNTLVHLFFICLLFGTKTAIAQTELPKGVEQIFTNAEEMPTLKSGTFEDFVKENIVYPKEALKNMIEGIAFVNLVINQNGKVLNARILKGLSCGCDEEALRIVNKTSGIWNAGVNCGKKVKVEMILGVAFKP